MKEFSIGAFIAMGILSLVIVALLPFALIWSLNGLFSLAIPYDLFHWICAFVLIVIFNASVTKS